MDEDFIFVECPHCNDEIIIKKTELNCCIFRHGIYKTTWKQINPHMKKTTCDELLRKKLIYGCGKPFKIIKLIENDDKYKAIICDYI